MLIVDDNVAFRAAVRQLLERDGYVVVAEAGDGNEGIEEARAHEPELAIVDLQLPGADGFEVAESLSALDVPPRVILTSSLDDSDFGELVASSPALGFVPKAELSTQAIDALLGPR